MQDAERLQEQIDEMVAKAEARAEVAQAHYETVVKQRQAAARELAKFQALNEVFTLGQNLMKQRKKSLLESEPPPDQTALEGIDAAIDELGRISRQALDAIQRFDGSQTALKSLEEAFHEEEVEATSRARGLAVQGQKAVDVASGRVGTLEETDTSVETGMPLVAEAAKKVPGLIESIQKKRSDDSSAKVPIGSP